MTETPKGEHWHRYARSWGLLGPPLRPSPEDVRLFEDVVARSTRRPLRALLLGVTPEIATMGWPAGAELTAIDRNASMIAGVFPTSGLPPGARAVEGDWLKMPFEEHAFDVVIGDGCLTTLEFGAYGSFAEACRRVLDRDGALVLRLFVSPEERETLEEIAGDLWAGRIGSFHVLKWRVAMAGERDDGEHVRLGKVYDAYRRVVPEPARLASHLGWDEGVIGTIEAYRDNDTRYSFPTLAAVRRALSDAFVEKACDVPGYELGARCPRLVLHGKNR